MADKEPPKSAAKRKSQSEPEPTVPEPSVSKEDYEDPCGDSEALVDELGVEDLQEILFGGRGRLFSAAGRETPIAEFKGEALVLHPPQKPFDDDSEVHVERILYKVDDKGILLNEIGQQRKIIGCKFNGYSVYVMGETKPGTLRHYAAWFDEKGKAHKLYVQKEALTADMIFRIRNRTHDGEIGIFAEITSD